jgi:hypothetical protein
MTTVGFSSCAISHPSRAGWAELERRPPPIVVVWLESRAFSVALLTGAEVVMTKILLIATAMLIGGTVAQDPPGNKSEAPTPAPPAQQNAPPDKLAPGRLPSPNAVAPDDKAEGNSPALKMDSAGEKKSPAAKSRPSSQN